MMQRTTAPMVMTTVCSVSVYMTAASPPERKTGNELKQKNQLCNRE